MRRITRPVPALWLMFCSCLCLGQSSAQAQPTARPILVRTPPTYPELARRMHVSGAVVVRIDIEPDGTVAETHVESGHALLRRAAEDAVRHWRFAPGPESSISLVTVSFNSIE